jgi:hypothetical protein
MIQTPNRNRFSSSLILAALLLLIPLSSCGGGDSTPGWGSSPASLTPTQTAMDQGATSLCQKAAQCSGVTNPSASDMSTCKQEVGPVVSIFPDAADFEACITRLSCSSLENDQTAILTCLNLNLPAIKCNTDGATLHACTNNGVCSDIPCGDVCTYLGGSYMYCGYASEKGHDVCWCQQ